MFGRILSQLLPAKAVSKRISGLVLGVFVLQVIAAGFCVSTASAAPMPQVSSEMAHCMGGNMSGMDMHQGMAKHACSHCDMPDATISFDKHSFDVADWAAHFVVVALVPTVSDVQAATFVVSPPDLQTQYTSLSTYHLNLRLRV